MTAIADIAIGRVDALHPRSAVDLHGEGDHRFAQPKAQGGDACGVHLVGNDVDAAKDAQIEGGARKGLAQQQRTPRLHRQIDRRERSRTTAGLEKRGARAIDQIDGAVGHSPASIAFKVMRGQAQSEKWPWRNTMGSFLRVGCLYKPTRRSGKGSRRGNWLGSHTLCNLRPIMFSE